MLKIIFITISILFSAASVASTFNFSLDANETYSNSFKFHYEEKTPFEGGEINLIPSDGYSPISGLWKATENKTFLALGSNPIKQNTFNINAGNYTYAFKVDSFETYSVFYIDILTENNLLISQLSTAVLGSNYNYSLFSVFEQGSITEGWNEPSPVSLPASIFLLLPALLGLFYTKRTVDKNAVT